MHIYRMRIIAASNYEKGIRSLIKSKQPPHFLAKLKGHEQKCFGTVYKYMSLPVYIDNILAKFCNGKDSKETSLTSVSFLKV